QHAAFVLGEFDRDMLRVLRSAFGDHEFPLAELLAHVLHFSHVLDRAVDRYLCHALPSSFPPGAEFFYRALKASRVIQASSTRSFSSNSCACRCNAFSNPFRSSCKAMKISLSSVSLYSFTAVSSGSCSVFPNRPRSLPVR